MLLPISFSAISKKNGYATLIGEFNGVAYQIKQYLADASAIPNERLIETGFITYIKVDTFFLRTHGHDADNPFKQRGQVKRGMFQFNDFGFYFINVQQIINQHH